jgi:hypothetical protein
MRHYVYKIVEKETDEFYWGVRSCDCDPKDDNYMGSMATWKPNKEKLVKTRIIEFPTREIANEYETKILKVFIDKRKYPLNRNYAITNIKWCKHGLKISEEHKRKISEAAKNMSDETRLKISEAVKNRSKETLQKISDGGKGRIYSKESRKKMSDIKKDIKKSEEHKRKLSESQKGKTKGPISDSHRENLRKAWEKRKNKSQK